MTGPAGASRRIACAVKLGDKDLPLGLDAMDTRWLEKLNALGVAAYHAFLWPGLFIVTQFIERAPAMSTRLGIDVDGSGTMLSVAISLLVWALPLYLVWRLLKNACLFIYYNVIRIRTFFISTFQSRKAQKAVEVATNAMKKSEVVFDDVDVAVLNTGMALAPGQPLCAPQLSDHLTKGPALIKRSLEKLKNYGLISDAGGTTNGYDNYQITPSGAALMGMWQRDGKVPE